LKHPILITGAAGFVGSNLTRYFVSRGIKVNIMIKRSSNIWRLNDIIKKTNVHYADISDINSVKKIIKKIKPKTIYHLATHGGYSDQTDLVKIKKAIIDATYNLINECKKYKFNIFVNTGSSSEYGFKNKAMKESDILVPNSYYSVFKSSSSLYCQYESLKSNIQIVTIRPFHVYGPYERSNRLIPTLIRNMLNDKKVKLVSPKISRDMIYISDVVNFYIMLANKKNLKGEIFNLGSGKKTTIKRIYNLLKKITNYKVKNYWGSMKNRYWDQSIWYSNNSYVKTKLNWKPKVSLKKGLTNTVNWYKKFYNE
jgi:nucleoside-diphosphate-sugar epimerase|tara:strand:- start:1096 stop:2028 length:933 start_codon:yes stop_codon:yes gene_type:complete